MDFRTEIAKWGYNKGNSIDVEILVNEILPTLFSQQERSYSEEEVRNIVEQTIEKFYKHRYVETKSEMKELWFEQFKKK
jgi:hypothetical protein